MSTADQLLAQAFQQPRDPRSPEYRADVLAALRLRLGDSAHVVCPYGLGTAQADAWFSGTDEGHALGRAHRDAQTPACPSNPGAANRPLALHGREPTQRAQHDE
jgi:hypothetical protein